jgi:2-polyprenyl-3-methyl-5-hydroxy-6-metoxy-1,4-benzoquinol methylase
MITIDQCWCGSEDLDNFSEHYYKCRECHTLLNKRRMSEEFYKAGEGSEKFYGKHYWTNYLTDEYGYPDIVQLSRSYLAERCIYWLRDILKYKLPPAKTLELGCGHGALVFLMKLAGYESAGTEMSQWICDYAQKTFDIPMMCGRIEDLNIPPHSYDMLVLMDVLEHMTEPVDGLKRIAQSLKDDGIAVIQTPYWRETEKTYEEMKAESNIFLEQLKEKEHLYLFNENSIKRLLNETGFSDIAFEKPIFPYDMFLIAGKQQLNKIDEQVIIGELQKTPERRIALALLDVYQQIWDKNKLLAECEVDRAARLEIINRQSKEFAERLDACEEDRAARLKVINQQAEDIGKLQRRIQLVELAYLELVKKNPPK